MSHAASLTSFLHWQKELATALDPDARQVAVCGGTGCGAFGAAKIRSAFEGEVAARGLDGEVSVKTTGCNGFCEKGPVVVTQPDQIFYPSVQTADVGRIMDRTVLDGEPIQELLLEEPVSGKRIAREHDLPFFSRQARNVFRLNGVVDPVDLEDYVARDGYSAVAKALGMAPEQVIDEIRESGLRGRGGAGFLTGVKWGLAREAEGEPKYLVCNADEGDPGAFMDRTLLEGTPHAIIEGMMIAAYAIGATEGIIYVRAEYPMAVRHSTIAVQQARDAGLLGADILGTGFDFDIRIHQGGGAFISGEESALIASLEGQRGVPRPRPPFPVVKGFQGKPTNINNVETLANVPLIILRGSDWYRGIGTEGSKGTKVFVLAGKVNHTGLVEVPMGTTLREIVFDIGGGFHRGRHFKAVHLGGPSGGCLPARYLDLPIDFDSVKEVGVVIGQTLEVMDESACMVEMARFFTEFAKEESCGKCAPCRIGMRQMYDILVRITEGKGELTDIDRLETLGKAVRAGSLCGLGQTCTNPVLSTIRHFRDEYVAHIVERRCPANSCKEMVGTPCIAACPAHVNVPEYVALIKEGRPAEALETIRRRNPFPSVCGRACDHPCETFCTRAGMDEAVAIRNLKRFASDVVTDVGEPPVWEGPRVGRVAIIGAGPSGLTAGYFLSLMGREVTVFEKDDVIGGALISFLPAFRLPRDVLARDVEYIRRAGVEIQTGRNIESIQDLLDEGFDAVFVAIGAQESAHLGVPGEDKDGVEDTLAFLRKANGGQIEQVDGKVVVVGGGNAAIDAARTSLRLGAESVTVHYRRSREEMPALEEEVEDAMHEGVQIHFLSAPVAIEGNGRVTHVRCVKMELGDADEQGRRRPIPVEGSESLVDADLVIVAIGQQSHLGLAEGYEGLEVKGKRFQADPVSQRAGESPVFVGGDVVTGPSTIIQAIGAGQRAAVAIDVFLNGQGQLPTERGLADPVLPGDSVMKITRQPLPLLSRDQLSDAFDEIVQGYEPATAGLEATRCLRCDLST